MSRQKRKRSQVLRPLGLLGIIALLVCGSATASGSDAAKSNSPGSLVIGSVGGSWGQGIQIGLVEGFEQATGIKVTLTSTLDTVKSEAAVKAGQTPPEDIIDTDLGTESQANALGFLAPVDYSLDPKSTLKEIPSSLLKPWAEGFTVYSLGLAYRISKYPKPPTTWKDFWNFTRFPGERGMLIWPDEPIPEFPELAAGIPKNKLIPPDYALLTKEMNLLKPHVPQFTPTSSELIQQLADGTIDMCACPLHRVAALQALGYSDTVGIAWGTARYEPEGFAVWKNAPNKANAMKFLAYALTAKAQANLATAGYLGPVNKAAFKFMTPTAIANAPNSPEHIKMGAFAYNTAWYIGVDPASKETHWQEVEDWWNKWSTGG